MTEKVLYAELTPREFRARIEQAPIAYLPLGTLEWHGEHLPIGADGLQSQGFFEILAREVGGIVLPMLFLGPDRVDAEHEPELYGMDICKYPADGPPPYPNQQLAGSAYWVPEETYRTLVDAVLKQLRRAGFRIVVGHGHGPSNRFFRLGGPRWMEMFGLDCFTCATMDRSQAEVGIQTDHAAMNETSLLMAMRPDLVQMENLDSDPDVWPLAVGGKDPRVHASAEVGRKAIETQRERMAGILREKLAALEVDSI